MPKEYRSWLAATGGGQPSDDIKIRNGVVTEFYRVEPHGVSYSLVSTHKDRAGALDSWVPSDFLVVSAEAGGVVAIKVVGDDIGSVWWADYDIADDIAPRDEHQNDPLPESWTGSPTPGQTSSCCTPRMTRATVAYRRQPRSS